MTEAPIRGATVMKTTQKSGEKSAKVLNFAFM
jgi:hypothetical protein